MVGAIGQRGLRRRFYKGAKLSSKWMLSLPSLDEYNSKSYAE